MYAPDSTITVPVAPYTPEWWRDRLLPKLRKRAHDYHRLQKYFDGDQPLAFASAKFRDLFAHRYGQLPANFMPLVVDSEAERLIVQGFRFKNRQKGDDRTWDIWQDNQMDAESQIAHEIALTKGIAYSLVAPGNDGPIITIEDPCEVILETAPGNRRERRAAVKSWTDDDGHALAYLYLSDSIYKWRSDKPSTTDTIMPEHIRWLPFALDGEDWPVRNPLGVVPVIPLPNRPRRDGTGRSEIEPIMGSQNAINKLRFDALVASEYIAFPQRWALNIDVPVDPDTGQEIAPFRPGVDNLWVVRRPTAEQASEYGDRVPAPELGQFPQADLGPYIAMIREEVGQMASNSRTPYHYLLGQPSAVPPSGESLKASEAPLVHKVKRQSVYFGEGWEETMRVALIADGETAKARTDGETIWADPETRNEAARTDSVIKQYTAGLLTDEVALEALGYSEQQIERIMSGERPKPVGANPLGVPDAPEPDAETPPV